MVDFMNVIDLCSFIIIPLISFIWLIFLICFSVAGRRNYRYFFMFLLSLSLHMSSIFILSLIHVLHNKHDISHVSWECNHLAKGSDGRSDRSMEL